MIKSKKQYTQEDFERHCREIERATKSDLPIETAKQKNDRIASLLSDYKLFFEYYFPNYAKSQCAWFHILIAHLLLKNKVFKGILEWFRGAAKSVHADLGYPMWLKAHGQMKCMLLVGQTEPAAAKLLAGLQAQFTSNKRYINDFGEQNLKGNWADGEFITKDGTAFYAIGIGQSPRGARNEEFRPDYIVVDDVDTKKRCKNPRLVREAIDWVMEDLMGCFDEGFERFLLVNNRFSKTSILSGLVEDKLLNGYENSLKELSKILKDNGIKPSPTFTKSIDGYTLSKKGNWYHLKVNAIDKQGNPTWPEKYTRQYWHDKREDLGSLSFSREYLNNPVELGKVFKTQWIKYKKVLPLHEYDQLVAYCDPSFKNTATSDYKAIVLLGRKGREIHIIKSFCKQASISTMVRWFYDLHESLPKTVLCDYWIEASFMQDMLMDEFAVEGDARGYQLPIRGDTRQKPEKYSRIEAMSPLFERGFVYVNEDIKSDPDFTEGLEQLLAIEPGYKTPDDWPDATEGGVWMLQRSGRTQRNEIRVYGRDYSKRYKHLRYENKNIFIERGPLKRGRARQGRSRKRVY